ncbi:MAG: coproporphyrinogen-III oxidase family protein [bacterium]|nr:coproporphyrinogen-III oxidase family protein [bacterium]
MIWNLESGIWNKQIFSLYIHIPFCRRLCPYCHFYRVPEIPPWESYLEAVRKEIEALDADDLGAVHTLYAGGGTPTLLPPEFYAGVVGFVRDRFDLSGLMELSIETDGDGTPEFLSGYARAGFDRVSVGVKSFDPRIQKILGAGERLIRDPVAAARSAGFASVGVDLIYGIEGQSLEDLLDDLDRTVSLDPDHISLYALEQGGEEQGPGRRAQGGKLEGCEPDLAAAMFRESARMLRAAGFRQYEITNFSRPGHRSLHNMVYWRDGDFIGLGPSAHSCVTRNGVRTRWRNLPDINAYLKDPVSCREELSREGGLDRAREALIMALRMTEGVNRDAFRLRYGSDPLELLKPHLAELMEFGLVRFSANRVRLTMRGMLLSNEVFVRIL